MPAETMLNNPVRIQLAVAVPLVVAIAGGAWILADRLAENRLLNLQLQEEQRREAVEARHQLQLLRNEIEYLQRQLLSRAGENWTVNDMAVWARLFFEANSELDLKIPSVGPRSPKSGKVAGDLERYAQTPAE